MIKLESDPCARIDVDAAVVPKLLANGTRTRSRLYCPSAFAFDALSTFHVSHSGIGARTALISAFLFCPRMFEFLFPTVTEYVFVVAIPCNYL